MSLAGRVRLIRSVLSTVPLFLLFIFKLPKGVRE